jgi:polysaccharide biosynthesis protein PslG
LAQQSGLKILFSVEEAPTFYQRAGGGLIPSDPTTYQTFMQTMANRYAGKVAAYEIWNEENLSRELGVGNVAPTSYLPLLEAGTRGVRAGDPSALVLLGAPSPTGANLDGQSIDDLSYLQQLYNPTPPAGYEYCSALTEQNQATFLVQAFTLARGLDYVGGLMHWCVRLWV